MDNKVYEICEACGCEFEHSDITKELCFNCYQEYQYELSKCEED